MSFCFSLLFFVCLLSLRNIAKTFDPPNLRWGRMEVAWGRMQSCYTFRKKPNPQQSGVFTIAVKGAICIQRSLYSLLLFPFDVVYSYCKLSRCRQSIKNNCSEALKFFRECQNNRKLFFYCVNNFQLCGFFLPQGKHPSALKSQPKIFFDWVCEIIRLSMVR